MSLNLVEKYAKLKSTKCYFNYHYWICLNMPKWTKFWICRKSEVCQNSEYGKVPKVAGFSICERFAAFWFCQNMPWRVLNISWILNMPGFWILQGSEYARITQDSEYTIMCLNMSEFTITNRILNMSHTI